MIGLGQGLTSHAVVLRPRLPLSIGGPVPYVLVADGPIEATLSQVEDDVEIRVTAPAAFAGTHVVARARIDSGEPIWLAAPTTVPLGGRRWRVEDDGLLLHPADGHTVVHTIWQLNGANAGTGRTFAAEAPGQTDSEVALVARASNPAGAAEIRSVVVDAVRYAVNDVVLTGAERVVGSLAGTPSAPRMALLWSGVPDWTESGGIVTGSRGSRGATFDFGALHDPSTGKALFVLYLPVRAADGTETDLLAWNKAPSAQAAAGTRVTCLVLMEAGQRPVTCISLDAGPFRDATTFKVQPAGSTVPIDFDTMTLGRANRFPRGFQGRHSCLRLWAPTRPLADLVADPVFYDALTDIDGAVKSASQQAPYLGDPLVDLSGPAADYADGTANAGTAGPFTVTQGTIRDHAA